MITALHGHHDALRASELERAKRLLGNGTSAEQVLEQLARGLTSKFLHGPTQALNQAFRSWRKGEPGGKPLVPSVIGSSQVIRVNKDLTQANIMMGHEGVPRNHPDYYAIQVMNYILGGGGFSSRAMDSIRNERGLAYSVYSHFGAEKSHGTFVFVMQTKNDTAEEAIRIAREEIRRMREQPVTDQELDDAKNYLTGSFPLRLDTNYKVASFLA